MSLVRLLSPALLIAALLSPSGAEEEAPRLNQVQIIGSHNSYHKAPPPEVLGIIGKFHEGAVEAWNKTMPTLTSQLDDAGIRQFELDIYPDPEGGIFAKPLAVSLAKVAGKSLPPFDPTGEWLKPGFKVLHVPGVDCWSNYPTLVSALREMAAWSEKHADHLPLMILIECKEAKTPGSPPGVGEFTRDTLMDLEKEILSCIPREKILFPDDVRRGEKSLPEALKVHGWPTVDATRGKFIFTLDNSGGPIRDHYLEGNPALENRLMFASAPDERHPAAAWFKCNDPVRQFDRIKKLVEGGFMVRTRADTLAPDPAMRQRAFDSGAQWISTDHFEPGLPEGQRVQFEGGRMVRSNPLNGTPGTEISP